MCDKNIKIDNNDPHLSVARHDPQSVLRMIGNVSQQIDGATIAW